MTSIFRKKHLLDFLNGWNKNHPLDMALHQYFKEHHSVGSKDRKFIREQVITLIRNLRLIDHPEENLPWHVRVERLATFQKRSDLPKAVQVSFPDFLYNEMVETWGEELAFSIAEASNTQAPITVRVNTLKCTREDLLKELAKEFPVKPTLLSSDGITFLEPVRFDTIDLFKKGFFEVQDEGSQLIAQMVDVKPKELFLDYCSGSGGKSLAIAPKMLGKGSLFLHDIRPQALQEARKRLKKAGIQNVQILMKEHQMMKKLKRKIDWVLVDAPCSGTGTLRRSPEMKWRLKETDLNELVETQKIIFDEALAYLKPGGKITYATCSILAKENSSQIEYFLSKYPLRLEGDPLKTYPKVSDMDGFFAATFRLD